MGPIRNTRWEQKRTEDYIIVSMKLPVAPNNGDRHFSKLFNVEETKGIIHSRIYPASDVVQSVWYNISGAILSLKIM
jgi:hypothetical protein